MASKLLKIDVNKRLILWTVDFFVNRSQTGRHQFVLSSSRSISTGFPKGTVLSPILFTLYTNDCTGTDTTPVIKYSDDSVIEDLSNSDSLYFAEVERFSNWCSDNSLDFSVKKTKEMQTDFRKAPTVIPDLCIDGLKVERVTQYKFHFIHKRCQPRIFCLQNLRSLNVSAAVLHAFYRSRIESVFKIFVPVLVWRLKCEKQKCPE